MTAHDTPRPDERAGLSEAEREALGRAYRGPWGPSHKTPDRLVNAVERIIADRLAAAVVRAEAAVRLVRPDHLTPMGARMILAALADVPTSAPTGEAP